VHPPATRIDAHQHFWDPARYSYPWMSGDAMDPVRRVFSPDDLRPALHSAKIDGTVLVQALSSLGETREFLGLAAATDFVHGVVGWIDLTSPSVGDDLEELLGGATGRWLVGIRHQIHDEPDPDWLRRDDERRGLAAVQRHGLSYDLLVRARELPAAIDAVRRLPELRFVVDHIAKPRIADGRDEPWLLGMPALAAEPNVSCKLSGLVTEADWATWTPRDLRPFVDNVLDWFTPERVLFGSDWPVCLLAGPYGTVIDGLAAALPVLSRNELGQIFGGNAQRLYRIGGNRAA
jgi:L-fuconolactonase